MHWAYEYLFFQIIHHSVDVLGTRRKLPKGVNVIEKTFGPRKRLRSLNPIFPRKMSPSRSRFRYQGLIGCRSEDDNETLSSVGWVGVGLLAIIALLVSYWAGIQMSRPVPCSKESYGLPGTMKYTHLLSLLLSSSFVAAPPGTIYQVWEHQPIFSQDLTPDSEAAWNSIIPSKISDPLAGLVRH